MSGDFELRLGVVEDADSELDRIRQVLVRVAVCMKLATMHRLDNAAMANPMAQMLMRINEEAAVNHNVRLQCVRDSFFLNRRLVRVDQTSSEAALMMRAILRRFAVHEIAFRGSFTQDEFRGFMKAFQERWWHGTKDDKPNELHEKVALRVLSKSQREKLLKQGDRRQDVLRSFVLLALAMREVVKNTPAGQAPAAGGLRRGLQIMYEASVDYEKLLLGLTRFPNPEARPYFHPTAVAALVLMMAKRLGVSRRSVSEIALGAMLLDMARCDLANPYAEGVPDDIGLAQAARSRTLLPLRSLMRMTAGGVSLESIQRASLSYESQQPVGEVTGGASPGAAARLATVASHYQLLTCPLPPRRGLTPDRALWFILKHAGDRYDPAAASLLADTIGRVPIGTVVKLSTGDTGIVSDVASDPDNPFRPPVKIVKDANGEDTLFELDLAEEDDEAVSIVETLSDIDEGINVPFALLGNLDEKEEREIDFDDFEVEVDEIEVPAAATASVDVDVDVELDDYVN